MDLNNPNIPILGRAKATSGPNAPGLTARMEIHDSEIIKIEEILAILRNRSMSSVNYEAFDREIKDRFAGIGFIVSVGWWTTNVEGTLLPEITISDRTERGHTFDHDQKVHEITNDLLGFGEGGVIKSNPADFEKQSHAGHGH